ncbi:MAG: DUF1893 domain-containing protein [Paludibacteraceae bacterium]|nr:DUF1893 domain-containing protein [Paludibacteraceae bacterium]
MKRTMIAVLMLAMLTGCANKSEQMLNALDEQGVGMLIDNGGERTSYNAPGVQDLLRLTAEEPERLNGAVVADRRVGKAAASLLIAGKVKAVNTPLVSTPAREMLEAAGISVYAREEIPLMVNKDGTDLCPMEQKLLEAQTPEECVVLLRGGSLVGMQMLGMLNEQGLSLLVYNDSTLTTHANRGVQDLLALISEQPERLNGAIVADKLIGKAAAAIMAAGGVREVHTNLICTAGKQLLQSKGVAVFAAEEVQQILNRDRSAQCPFDAQLNEIESVEECVTILQNMPKP